MKDLKQSQKKKGLRKGEVVEKNLSEMNRHDKKIFLQNDIVERMIRIEQAVAKDSGKIITYNESVFYKNLTTDQKKSFNKYMNSKKRNNVSKAAVLIAPLFAFGLMRLNITGNAIRDNTGMEPYWWGWVALGIFIGLGVYMWLSHLVKKNMEKRLDKHEKDLIKRLNK